VIVLWLLTALSHVFVWFVGVLPQVASPTWLGQLTTWVTSAVAMLVQMGFWLPVPQIATATAFVLACAGVSLGVKIARIVLSFLTAGGGSAA
jgi:hypothetical protein